MYPLLDIYVQKGFSFHTDAALFAILLLTNYSTVCFAKFCPAKLPQTKRAQLQIAQVVCLLVQKVKIGDAMRGEYNVKPYKWLQSTFKAIPGCVVIRYGTVGQETQCWTILWCLEPISPIMAVQVSTQCRGLVRGSSHRHLLQQRKHICFFWMSSDIGLYWCLSSHWYVWSMAVFSSLVRYFISFQTVSRRPVQLTISDDSVSQKVWKSRTTNSRSSKHQTSRFFFSWHSPTGKYKVGLVTNLRNFWSFKNHATSLVLVATWILCSVR